MKRRLFLKTGSIGIGGMVALPTVIFGCASLKPLPQGPSMGISLFQDSSRLFDSSIAELRISGSGELASAEAEDVTLSGTAEQIASGESAIPAELAENFTASSTDMLNAAGNMAESAHELFPINSGMQAELADDFALLKVVKASTLLASAAMATPRPIRKVTAAEKMVSSAESVHASLNAGSESELIESTGSLLAHSEEYVGAAERYSAQATFIEGVETFESAVGQLQAEDFASGVSNLLTSSDNIALSSGYFADGIDNLNAESDFFGGSEITSAEELIPYAEQLVSSTPLFVQAAKGESAEFGAAEMVTGAESLLSDSMSEVSNLGDGGATLDLGADQFIAGEIIYNGAEDYESKSALFLSAAEDLLGSYNKAGEAEHIESLAEELVPASQQFYGGAEALQKIKLTDGVESLTPAATDLLNAAELLQSEAEPGEIADGINQMLTGASEALMGAEKSASDPAKSLKAGAQSVELGTMLLMNGAAEFVAGYN